MFKIIFLAMFLCCTSLLAMQEGTISDETYSEQYKQAYQQAYLFGSQAVEKYRAKGMPTARALAITSAMKKEEQKDLSPEQFKPRIAALVDLLQRRSNRFAANKKQEKFI